MRYYLTVLMMSMMICFLSGCQEGQFAGGFASGVVAMETLADDAQDKFIEAVNTLNAETTKINDTIDEIEGTVLLRPDTLEAIQGLKGREKDPVTWVALASVLANMFWGGKSYAGRKSK